MNDIDYNFLDELDESFQTYDEIYSSDNWSESEAIEPVMTLQDLYQLCIEPNVKEGISHAAILLIWGLIFRLSTQIGIYFFFLSNNFILRSLYFLN